MYDNVLSSALMELGAAIRELLAPTEPSTSLPQPRFFYLVDGRVVWPFCDRTGEVRWSELEIDGTYDWFTSPASAERAARRLIELAGYQPRKILRTLRRIQAATAWCRARAEGRKRMAQEILRQQGRAVEALEAEAALAALGRN